MTRIISSIKNNFKTAHKSNKLKFYVFNIICLVTTIGDLLITYVGSPDLLLEANILVTVFGLGWTALIIANIFAYTLALVLLYYAFIKYKRTILECNSFTQYLSMLYFNRPDKAKWLWYKYPKGKMFILLAPVGFALAYMYPVLRLIAISGWVLHLASIEFCIFCSLGMPHFYFKHIEVVFFLIIGLIIMIFLLLYWYVREYKINKVGLKYTRDSGEYIVVR